MRVIKMRRNTFLNNNKTTCHFSSKKMNIISTSTRFVLLSKLLSQALFSTLHPFGFEGGKGGVVIARPRVKRRSSSLDFVSHNEKNKLLVESLFFLFVVSLFVLSSRTRKNTQRTQKKKKTRWCAVLVENIEYEAKERAEEGEESVITPTFEDECEEEEEDKEEEEEKEDEFLTSDDSESSLQCEDEELEQRDQRWEIVAKLPPVVACEEKRSSSSLLEAWMSAVPRKGKRKLKAVGFGRDTGNGFFKDLTECNFRVEVFRCIDERRAKREEEGQRSDGSFEKRRRVEIDEEDNDD
tara:strand:- start:3730 stop:4617 length:888 start_codon:yes stop_codon:yes gene_type:complete